MNMVIDPQRERSLMTVGHISYLLHTVVAVGAAEHDVAVLLGDARAPGGLSPREIEVLRLVAAGKSNPEIAAALGVPEGTVKTRLMRGREALAAQLGNRSER